MSVLQGKNILLGVTGSIAAYKAAMLIRRLREAGAGVRVVMTTAATQFITPMTLQALSGEPVRQALFDAQHEAAMGHIELARWADLILVAPASADIMARLATGMADDLLTTLCLATTAPIALAPAMNQRMWCHPATRDNSVLLQRHGVMLWGPAEGGQACGDQGPGRMLEVDELVSRLQSHFTASGALLGRRVLITAGPTREAIDPVRYLSNRSSGKMGYALAEACSAQGAAVTLISGPVALAEPTGVERVMVESALEMEAAVMQQVAGCDLFIGCAAVADYRPRMVAEQKIKKQLETMGVELVRNPDILARVAALPSPPFTVGFAAETQNPVDQADGKRKTKGVDMIAANLVGAAEGGFERDDNALTVLWEGGRCTLPMSNKRRLADALVVLIAEHYEQRDSAENIG